MSVDPAEAARVLAEAKRAAGFELLLRVARRVDEVARARLTAEAGRVVATRSTLLLLPHLDLGGTRIVDLAARLGISKQAAHQRVQELVAEGMVALEPDPNDRRARRVVFTEHGVAAIRHGLGVLAGVERDVRAQVGDELIDALRVALAATLRAVDALDDGSAG